MVIWVFSLPESIVFVFFDGVGLGEKNSHTNPFTKFKTHFFGPLGGASSFLPLGDLIETDAHMGYSGLPQSATGQVSLFTGFNGVKIMGRHINGFPTYSLRPYIKQHSLLKKMLEAGKKATLINSYSDWYLNRINSRRGERLMSTSSMMQRASGQPFFTLDDYKNGKSLYMDLTNWFLRKNNVKIPMISAKTTGRKLIKLAKDYDLIIYEYFITDKVGHSQSLGAAKRIIQHIESFMEGIWEEINVDKVLFILSSDHGNFEDLSTKHHTNNLVPTIVHGKSMEFFKSKIRCLYDIPRAIMKLKGVDWSEELS